MSGVKESGVKPFVWPYISNIISIYKNVKARVNYFLIYIPYLAGYAAGKIIDNSIIVVVVTRVTRVHIFDKFSEEAGLVTYFVEDCVSINE